MGKKIIKGNNFLSTHKKVAKVKIVQFSKWFNQKAEKKCLFPSLDDSKASAPGNNRFLFMWKEPVELLKRLVNLKPHSSLLKGPSAQCFTHAHDVEKGN